VEQHGSDEARRDEALGGNMSDERERKLPKWAQDELDSLRCKLNKSQNEAAILRNEIPSRIYAQDWAEIKNRRYLADRSPVYFETDSGRLCCFIREGVFDISCDGQIMTEHVASNCFRIVVKPR